MKDTCRRSFFRSVIALGATALTAGAATSTNQVPFIPGGVDSVGLTNIVPDVLLWYDSTANHYTNGPVNVAAQEANLGNWEPYTSVVGDSTFVIGATTFADDETAPAGATATGPFQRFIVTFQPAVGGTPKIGEEFFTDAGAPFRGVINLSRENGNPQRVAGDKRAGATNFLTAAETSIGQLDPFATDSRWSSNVIYQADNRYVTVQPFSLDPAMLVQTPLHKAFDAVYGNLISTTAPASQPQVSRTGGTVAGLDNGNFVVVIDDKTSYVDTSGEVTTFAVITPTGSVVKSATLVDPRDIWDNVAACQGGFAVRVHDMLYFYDNSGTLQHTNNLVDSSGLAFGTGREDGSRIGGDIRSPYVYLAGQAPESGKGDPVSVAVWDSRTGQFVSAATVTDTDPSVQTVDRVAVAVDALDRFCVVYGVKPTADFPNEQVAARVGKLVGTNITFLTSSFFPFVNHDKDGTGGITTVSPSVTMTTREICIAAKGTVNSTNNPTGGANTAAETTLYTVISHPDPKDLGGSSGQPAELGQLVNGFQDDFTAASRNTNWVAVGPGGDHYVQTNGVLQVAGNHGDPNHLLYMGPGGSNSVQEVLARLRVVAFGTGDPSRGGIATGVITNLPSHLTDWSGINLQIRDNTQDNIPGRQFKFLDDLRAWGPAGLRTNIPPQTTPGWTNNVWYWLRLKMDGTNGVFGKVWTADGATSEPNDWQMTWAGSSLTKPLHAGYAGITASSADGLSQFEVDYILIKATTLPSITVNFAPQGAAPTLPEFQSVLRQKNNLIVDWFGGYLQSSSTVTGVWADVANAANPKTNGISGAPLKFYRIRQ